MIADNASIHHNDRFRELVEARGAIVLYLSPYSPDYNPIERAWAQVKAWLARHREYAAEVPRRAMFRGMAAVTAANMRAYFRAALPDGMPLPLTDEEALMAMGFADLL